MELQTKIAIGIIVILAIYGLLRPSADRIATATFWILVILAYLGIYKWLAKKKKKGAKIKK